MNTSTNGHSITKAANGSGKVESQELPFELKDAVNSFREEMRMEIEQGAEKATELLTSLSKTVSQSSKDLFAWCKSNPKRAALAGVGAFVVLGAVTRKGAFWKK